MRRKHVPQRTCIACGQVLSKRELVRVVRTPDGHVKVDPSGKHPGRGAYLCRQASCWEHALSRGHLERALKIKPSMEDQAELVGYGHTIPQGIAGSAGEP